MTSKYDIAFEQLLKLEGGYTVDHTGPTNYGITLPTLRSVGLALGDMDKDGDIDETDVRLLTPVHSKEIYRVLFWNKYDYNRINDINLASKVFEMSVNCGPAAAHKALQRACRACGVNLLEDGIIGFKTVIAVNSLEPKMLLAATRSEIAGFYRLILAKRPEFAEYRVGWLTRAYS